MKVLLVEDDDRVAAALTAGLRMHRICVERARTAAEGRARMRADVEAVVLDLGLPDEDGFSVLTAIRRAHDVPIIIATAKGDLNARVHGLYLGADDYLVKPFEVLELLARLHAVHRRTRRAPTVVPRQPRTPTSGADAAASADSLVVDEERQSVRVEGREVLLTRKEFEVLALLASNPGVVFRREHLLSRVWESDWRGGEHTLTVHMAALRSKLGCADLIETVRGVGYRLRQPT